MNRDQFEIKLRYLGYSQAEPSGTERHLPYPAAASGGECGSDMDASAPSEAQREQHGDGR